MSDIERSLEEEPVDRLAALVRASTGLVPIVGPVLSELINNFIPNQRVERIGKYLKELESMIADIRKEHLSDPANIDLIEDGGFQAIRAISDQRIKLLARCVSNGLHADTSDKLNEKRILFIVSQLDEGDLLLLDAFDKGFRSQDHQELQPEMPHIGCSKDKLNRRRLYEASIQKLENMNLLHFSIRMDKDLEVPKFDKFTGRPRGSRTVSSLGRLVLFRADLRSSEEPS